MFFFRAKTSEKIENECCLIDKPRHFFNLECKTVFNNICPLHKTCVLDIVDSMPKYVKVKLSSSLFLDQFIFQVHLFKIIERIPELRFKYSGSYPSDKVPQQTKYSFAMMNSAQSTDGGEHWIMIARLNKNYFFADSLEQKRTTKSFVTKKVSANGYQKNKKNDNLCGFYAIYSSHFTF